MFQFLEFNSQYIRWRSRCEHPRRLHARQKGSVPRLYPRPAPGSPSATCLSAVTEGYLTSPPSAPLKQAPVALTGAAGYQLSARENNRQLFSSNSGAYTPLPSPSKRKRSHPDPHDDDQQSITPFFISPQSQDRGHLAAELSSDDMVVDRPMKPLRRSGRIREMSPLPPACSLFRRETEMNSHQCEECTNMRPAQLPSLESA